MAKNTRIYWYDYVDINNLLNNKSNGGLFYYVADTASQNAEQALQRVDAAYEMLNLNPGLSAAVIPINLGHVVHGIYQGSHWVSLVLRRNFENNNIEALYNDSLGRSMDSSLPNIRQILHNHDIPNERIRDFQTIQQDNGYDCGAWTVFNLDSLARTGNLPEVTVKDIIQQRKEEFSYIPLDALEEKQISKVQDQLANTNKQLEHTSELGLGRIIGQSLSSDKPKLHVLEELRGNVQLSKTIDMAYGMLQFFQRLFTPQDFEASQLQDIDPAIFKQTMELFINPNNTASLLIQAPNFISKQSLVSHPGLKSSESNTMHEIMARSARQLHPQFFTSLDTEESEPAEMIFYRFFKEFIQGGALDGWVTHIRSKAIENKRSDEPSNDAMLEFIDTASNFLKRIGSNSASDSAQDPLNKYIKPEDISRAISLREWLEHNQGHQDYDERQSEFSKLDQSIMESRKRAMEEGSQYLFTLLKHMDPELPDFSQVNLMNHLKEKGERDKHLKFAQYIQNEILNVNTSEPNLLRTFWETVYREQYGSIYYKFVCESFQENYKDSLVHQVVQQIWAVSLLDTINQEPKEARSRMPGESIDGLPAPNFGYGMSKSDAYKEWIINPLVRASGDIIVDAFHYAVDFGSRLNIESFLELFRKELDDNLKSDTMSWYNEIYSHEYHNYIILLERYLLEKKFNVPFVSGNKKRIDIELKKVAKEKGCDLIEVAQEVLSDFQEFSMGMLTLRPSESNDVLQVKHGWQAGGLVFGVGFNGTLFDAPKHSNAESNEIWITFSKSGRNTGGYLLLEFVKEFAARHFDISNLTYSMDDIKFEKYKQLIKWHVKANIKGNYDLPDSSWDSHMLEHVQTERAKYEGFMSQLELGISFSQLDNNFKKWIQKVTNWYSTPADINIAEDIPVTEHRAQQFARKLLFDALMQKSFLTEYPNLEPLLFLHWKEEIVKKLLDIKPEIASFLQRINKFEEFSEQKGIVQGILNKLACRVHPVIKSVWEQDIAESFGNFKESKVKEQLKKLEKIDRSIKKITEILDRSNDTNAKLQSNLEYEQQKKSQIEKELQHLQSAGNPSELSLKNYREFREDFFKKIDVSQCMEPPFARVLGHDRFFPVFISKKVGRTEILDHDEHPLQLGTRCPQDVIAPCDDRCKYHALTHVYIGDMLSHQSADSLDQMRHTHGLGEVPNRWMTFDQTSQIIRHWGFNDVNTDQNSDTSLSVEALGSSCEIL